MDTKDVIARATDKAMGITPSVLVTARLSGFKPAEFAKSMYDEEANDEFLSEVVAASVAVAVKKAHEKKKEEKK